MAISNSRYIERYLLMFVDFHTHRDRQSSDLLNLQTLHVTPELQSADLPHTCSLGLHPWFVDVDLWRDAWTNLVSLAKSSQVKAIGECGLDRNIIVSKNLSMEVQSDIFQQHIQLAESLDKPLIIHCVRAFTELIALKKSYQASIPWIIHGFQKKESIFRELFDQGFYFSFGAAILNDRSPVVAEIRAITGDRFFLETDDRSDLTIEQIYARASELRQVSVEDLQQQLWSNYSQIIQS